MKALRILIFISITILAFLIISSYINYDVSAKHIANAEEELIKIDKEFSKKSFDDGILSAFLKYASEEAIILRERYSPIVGKKELEELYKLEKGSNVKLKWIPIKAELSKSNDLGYTYGKWMYISLDKDNYPNEKFGYYVTIWRKEKEGNWKFVLHSGNSTEADLIKFRELQ